MRHALCLGLCLLAQTALAATQPDPFPQVAAAYQVELDGKAIWGRHPDRRLAPASLTKLMTALLVLERERSEEIASISRAASLETGSRIGLRPGEQMRIKDLLAAALLQSANDACHALADHVAGNEAAFVKRMNQRAQELGLRATRFRNACGHDARAHYSSARDLARLARELLKHPQLVALTSLPSATITTVEGRRYNIANKNALIGRYDGALGLKTGYTARAGKCLVAYVKRGGHEVLLVMLHGQERWWDTVDILDLALDHARLAL